MQYVPRDRESKNKEMNSRLGTTEPFFEVMPTLKDKLNSEISFAIDECVNGLHAERNRAILKRSMIDGICYEPLAEEFSLSTQMVKAIVYKWRSKIYKYLGL